MYPTHIDEKFLKRKLQKLPKSTIQTNINMNPAQPVIVRSGRLSVPEVVELLESISDLQIFCDLPPVRAKGGEVHVYINEQHPSEYYIHLYNYSLCVCLFAIHA